MSHFMMVRVRANSIESSTKMGSIREASDPRGGLGECPELPGISGVGVRSEGWVGVNQSKAHAEGTACAVERELR